MTLEEAKKVAEIVTGACDWRNAVDVAADELNVAFPEFSWTMKMSETDGNYVVEVSEKA